MTALTLAPFPRSLLTRCGLCLADVLWGMTAGGKRIPLDPDPTEDGNQAVHRDGTGRINARQLRAGERPDSHERLMMPHFPTCEARRAARPARPAATSSPTPEGVVDLAAYRRRRKARGAR